LFNGWPLDLIRREPPSSKIVKNFTSAHVSLFIEQPSNEGTKFAGLVTTLLKP